MINRKLTTRALVEREQMKDNRPMINKKLVAIATVAAALLIAGITIVSASQTCPDDNGWTKIDSDDLSLYPVEGATQYCFKYGSERSNGCEGGISRVWPPETDEKYCGLSHWSYLLGRVKPTPTTTVTPTATPSATPTTEPTTTPAPEVTHKPWPTETPSKTDEVIDQWEEIVNNPEVYPAGNK